MLIKNIAIISIFICVLNPAFAQNECLDRVTKQAVELDSLKKVVKAEMEKSQQQIKINHNLQDTLGRLRSELTKLEENKIKMKSQETLLLEKKDSINILKANNSEKDRQITAENQKREQRARDEKEKGKNEILTIIINRYKNKPYDELLISSTIQSVQGDLMLVEYSEEVKQIILNLEIYFNVERLLKVKFDASQIIYAQKQLDQIKQESALVEKLKEKIGNYQTFNMGLKGTIEKIIALDNTEVVSGMSSDIQKKKFAKILAEVSSYIFNYDFNFSDYPYLSDVLIELIKRKQPNADADISDLSRKL